MRSVRSVRYVTLALACVAAVSCGDSTGPQNVSLDEVLADVNEGQGFAARGTAAAGVWAPAQPSAMHHADCAFNTGSQSFVCPTVTVNGVTFSRSFQLLDEAGVPQTAFDRATTAAVRTTTDVDGIVTITSGGNTTTIDLEAHQVATLSGLLTGTHILNANGTGNAAVSGGGLNHTIATTQTITNLELPRRDSETRYPKSGTIATEAVVSAPGFTNTTTATLTFNGTSTATLVFTNLGITRTCTIDLSQAHAAPNCTP